MPWPARGGPGAPGELPDPVRGGAIAARRGLTHGHRGNTYRTARGLSWTSRSPSRGSSMAPRHRSILPRSRREHVQVVRERACFAELVAERDGPRGRPDHGRHAGRARVGALVDSGLSGTAADFEDRDGLTVLVQAGAEAC